MVRVSIRFRVSYMDQSNSNIAITLDQNSYVPIVVMHIQTNVHFFVVENYRKALWSSTSVFLERRRFYKWN